MPAPVPPTYLPVPYTLYTGTHVVAPVGYVQRPGYVVYPSVAAAWAAPVGPRWWPHWRWW